MPSILVSPPSNVEVTPLGHSSGFGATVEGIDLNNLSQPEFDAVERALYTHKVGFGPV